MFDFYCNLLGFTRKPKKQLSAWEWDFDGSQAEYTALYPRAWSVFRIPDYAVTLVCRQISPIIPNNYKVCKFIYYTKPSLKLDQFLLLIKFLTLLI